MAPHALLVFSCLFIISSCSLDADPIVGANLLSPDATIEALFRLTAEGELHYSLQPTRDRLGPDSLANTDQPMLAWLEERPLGIHELELGELRSNFEIMGVDASTGRETYDLPWGEVARVDAAYSEIQLALKHAPTNFHFQIRARLFDDGLGFRYEFPEQSMPTHETDTLRLLEELTGFGVSGNPLVNWGPGDWNSYENRLELTRFDDIDAKKYDNRGELISRVVPHNAVMTPVTMRLADGTHLSIHEAALIDYPEMTLEVQENGGFRSTLAGSPNRPEKVVRKLPFTTPWRTIAVERRAIDLVANTLVLNLNPPNQLGDISWFEPKTYAGVWWEMFLGKGTWDYASSQSAAGSAGESEQQRSIHAANTDNVKRYIDFCADNDIGGLLVEGWNTGWEVWLDSVQRLNAFDFVTPYPDYNLEEVVRYGKSKGVEIVMHHETSAVPERYEHQLDAAFGLMQRLGLHTVKSGYVGNFPNGEYHHGQYGVQHYRKVFEKAAEYEVAVNPHEPIKPTGERRTLPNAISAEGARGMEYNAFGDYTQVNQPSHLPSIVYTRALAGPFDYTPGIFNLEMEGWKGADEEVLSTLGKQLGAYVVIMAPIQMVADLPEHYLADEAQPVNITRNGTAVELIDLEPASQRIVLQSQYHPAMAYIRAMATNWDATYPLAGELGEYAVVARKVRDEDRYFIGGIAGDEDRTVTVPLDFLPSGRSFEFTLYRDADDAHFRENKKALTIERSFATSTDVLTVTMRKAGGFGGIFSLSAPDQ